MQGQQNTRWVAMSALGAAMFSIGFSVTGVACNARSTTVAEAQRDEAAGVASAPAKAAATSSASGAASATPSASPASAAASASASAVSGTLHVRRLVVTRKIENREPIEGTELTVGTAPIYAFVELDNEGDAARGVRILFENERSKATVGHVKLSVPASQPHFRTWGNTRMIAEPGRWVAVVSTSDGTELARAPFDVKG